jgi:hypothetical protein
MTSTPAWCAWFVALSFAPAAIAWVLPQHPQPPPVEKIGPSLFRVGNLQVDSAKRELTVSGHANEATILEFVACTPGGLKAYESALTLDTDAITFNAGLLLLGLDKAHAVVPTRHFDPKAPAGDPVELWVEWKDSATRRVRVEQLLYDKRTRKTLPEGPWVYTGSTFVSPGRYLAAMDGVLIGFVHSPAPIIENPRSGAVNGYGSVVMNPALGLAPGTDVRLTVKAIGPAAGDKQ